jgi:hypothetical protein
MSTRPGNDDVFEPSLAGYREAEERPWRLGSQFYVAFFGGVAAVTAIAWLNAKRLGLDERKRLLILLAGAAGLVATVVVPLVTGEDAADAYKITSRIVGVVAFGAMYLIQRSADRVHESFGDEDETYASLWGPGLAAVLVGGVLQAALVFGVLSSV